MRRNYDLCREILDAIESDREVITLPFEDDEIKYHLALLRRRGYVEKTHARGQHPDRDEVTWAGHDFLAELRMVHTFGQRNGVQFRMDRLTWPVVMSFVASRVGDGCIEDLGVITEKGASDEGSVGEDNVIESDGGDGTTDEAHARQD